MLEEVDFRRNTLGGILTTEMNGFNGDFKYEFNIRVGEIFRGGEDMNFVGQFFRDYFGADYYKDVGGNYGETGGRKIFARGSNFVYADINLSEEKLRVFLRQMKFEKSLGCR